MFPSALQNKCSDSHIVKLLFKKFVDFLVLTSNRRSRLEVIYKKRVLKNFPKFTGKH